MPGAIPQTDRTQPLVATVVLDEQSGQLEIGLRTDDGQVVASRPVFVGRTERVRWATMVPGVTAAVLPAGVTAAVPVWQDGEAAQGSAATRMPDGRVLVVWWTDGSAQDTFYDVISTDGDQVVSASYSANLLTVVRHDVLYFVDPGGGILGHLTPPGETDVIGSGATARAPNEEPGAFPAVWADAPSGSGGTYAVFLSPVEDVELVVTGDARVRDITVYDFGEIVGLLVLADVEGARESVTGVRFTDPNGTSTGGPAPAD